MINKEISIVLTQAEIDSPEDIQIKFHLHSEDDPNNEGRGGSPMDTVSIITNLLRKFFTFYL